LAKLSITTAWDETVQFVKRDAGPLFIVAFALTVLPSIVLQIVAASLVPLEAGERAVFLLLTIAVVVLSVTGTISITALAVGRRNVVGQAIGLGFRRFLPMFGAAILIGLAALIALIPIVALSGIDPEALAASRPEAAAGVMRVGLIFLLIFLLFWPRLILMTPVGALESVGPIGIIRRSWQLTRGHFWKLLGFALLLMLVILVVMLAITFVFGSLIAILAGPPHPGTLSSTLMLLLGGLLNAVIVVFFTTFVARIYIQLSGEPTSGI
jgi:hypothetical protein